MVNLEKMIASMRLRRRFPDGANTLTRPWSASRSASWSVPRSASLCASRLAAIVLAVGLLTAGGFAIADTAADRGALVEPLRVEMMAAEQAVVVTLVNDTLAPIAFLPWGTPFGDVLDADVLSIRDTAVLPALRQELPYNGLLLKRGDPRAHNLVTLNAGQSVTARVTPADHYAIDTDSSYQIYYRGEINYTTNIADLADQSSIRHGLATVSLLSDSVELDLIVPPETRAVVAPDFASCSASQQADLQSALLSAETIARNASIALGGLEIGQRSNSPRYVQWFGTYSETRFNFVNAGFNNLRSVLENSQIEFVCGCLRDATFAFVNRARPFEINLCPAFWPAPENGRDSRAGTIVHELSHFNQVVGTADFKYGQKDTALLAVSEPDQAVINADNYEYFAENTPALAITDVETGITALELDVEQSGSLGEQQSQYFSVTGARSIELTSVNGDADLYVYSSFDDQNAVCQSRTTAVVDVCNVETLTTAIVRVFAYSNSEFRVIARSGIVTVQGGNSGSSDGGGSMGIAVLLLAPGLGLFRRLIRRRRSVCSSVYDQLRNYGNWLPRQLKLSDPRC